MTRNQTQLTATKQQITALKAALESPGRKPDQVDSVLWSAQFDEIAALLETMEEEVREYEVLAKTPR